MMTLGLMERSFAGVPSGLLDLLDERQGWGEDACDAAAGWELYTVTTGADSGAGSLRAALESSTAYWVVFDPAVTTVSVTTRIAVEADKVVDGRGVFPTITNSGLGDGCFRMDGNDFFITDCTVDGGFVTWDLDSEGGDAFNSNGNVQRHIVSYCHIRRAGDGGWDARNGLGQYFTLQNSLLTETFQGFNHTADFVSSLRNLMWNVRRRAMQMIDGKGYIGQCAIGGPSGESWDDPAILSAKETLSDGSVYSDDNAFRADAETTAGETQAGGSSMNFNGDIEFFGAVTQPSTGTVDAGFVTASRANWDRVAPSDDFDRWNVIWRACGGGPRSEPRGAYCVGKATGTGTSIDFSAIATVQAGDILVIGYKGETGGGASQFSISGFTRLASSGPGNIRLMTFVKLAAGGETTASISGNTTQEFIASIWRSPGKAFASITPSTWQVDQTTNNPSPITVSPGTTERLCMAVVTYGSDGAVDPRTSSITMAEVQGASTDLYMKFMVWDARFNPPPASFTADMDDEGGGNAVQGGYLDIT